MNKANLIVNIFVAIGTIGAVIVALYQTFKQIKQSNKQYLFEQRVNLYLTFAGLIELYKNNQSLLKIQKENELVDMVIQFRGLTNNLYLKDIGRIINNLEDENVRIEFLSKLEEIKKDALKIELIFKGKYANYMSQFVFHYQELLVKIYRYQLVFEKMVEKNRNNPTEYANLQKEFGENKYREELYDSFSAIYNDYKNICDNKVIENIKKQIKLIN